MPLSFRFFLILLVVVPSALGAQTLEQKLWKAGFEQVHILAEKDTVHVFFEKRSFRYPLHSMEYGSLLRDSVDKRPFVWIPLYNNRPIGAYKDGSFMFRALSKPEINFYRKANDLTNYRFHFRLMPDFNGRFGYYSDPFQNKTSLILDTRLYLLPGLSLHSGILFPIYNSLDNQPLNIRPGPTMLSWFGHRGKHFITLTTGTFLSSRYGIDMQYRYAALDGFFSFGLETSYTGYYFWPESGLYTESLKDFMLIADAEYRLPQLPQISLRLSAGQFLGGDLGARADLIRQWGPVDISFYVAASTAGRNAGFQFIVPIFPGNLLRTNRMEFRTAEEFPWEYSFNNEETVARRFRLSVPRLSEVVRQYNHHIWVKP